MRRFAPLFLLALASLSRAQHVRFVVTGDDR